MPDIENRAGTNPPVFSGAASQSMPENGIREKLVITFILFTEAIAIISYLKTKDDGQTTAEGYFLAGRGLLGFVIVYALFEVQGTQVPVMDDAYPQLTAQVVPAPLMGFFAAVMFGAIISSFNSGLNSINTMFTMRIYADFINPHYQYRSPSFSSSLERNVSVRMTAGRKRVE